MSGPEHLVDEWLERTEVITLSQGQIAALIEAVGAYGEQRERWAVEAMARNIERVLEVVAAQYRVVSDGRA